MRILHINKYNHERDGVGRYLHDIMRLCTNRGIPCALLAMQHPNNTLSPWEQYFLPYHNTVTLGKGYALWKHVRTAWWNKEAYACTMRIIAAFKPTVIHVHNIYTHFSPSVLQAAYDAGIPVVFTFHDYGYISANYGLFANGLPVSSTASLLTIAKTRWIKGSFLATGVLDVFVRLQRKMHRWEKGVTHMLTASEHMKRAYVAAGYCEQDIQVLHLPSGVLTVGMTPSFIPPSVPRVVFAGRFEENKGIGMVFALAWRMPGVAFVCIGKRENERFVYEDNVPNNVTLLPVLPPHALWEEMRTASAVLMPTLSNEPFGLVALEALSLGTPVIASNRGALPEIIAHEVSGYVLEPRNTEAWIHAITQCLPTKNNQEFLVRMRKAAHARALAVGNPEAHIAALVQVYEESIKKYTLL